MFKKQKQQQFSRKGNNRWADDDDDNGASSNKNNFSNNTNFSHQSNNVPSFIKKSTHSNTSSNTSYNYNQSNRNDAYQSNQSNNIRKDTRFALEKKLIDDILQPTGIKIKPDEKLMVDFCRRAKNLDRTLIYSYLMEKISQYKTFVGNNEKINTLIKCLYLISYIVDSKIQDLYEAFGDNQQLFEDIKATLGQNRRVSELIVQILQFLGVEASQGGGSDYQNFDNAKNYQNQNEQPTSQVNNNNTNLLEFDSGDQTNNKTAGNINLLEDIFQSGGNNNGNIPTNNNNNINTNSNDLLGGIFGNDNNMNNINANNNNAFPTDIFGMPSQSQPSSNINNNNNQNSFFDNIGISNNNNNNNNPSQNSFFDKFKQIEIPHLIINQKVLILLKAKIPLI